MVATVTVSTPYSEPTIVTTLIYASLFCLLNISDYVLNFLCCGLVGQIFIGIAYGSPGAGWLSYQSQTELIDLGYLGLLLLVYEGGLCTDMRMLWRDLYMSALVAAVGITGPIALSFLLCEIAYASKKQAFAAGAALCSTSLGTTLMVLRTSGLASSRLGVLLTNAAMLDDLVGLVMVQLISDQNPGSSHIEKSKIIRPIGVSCAFIVIIPLACILASTLLKTSPPKFEIDWFRSRHGKLFLHLLGLFSLITGASYAGTSNLFAAYLAGTIITWFDSAGTDASRRDPHFSPEATVTNENTALQPAITGASQAIIEDTTTGVDRNVVSRSRDSKRYFSGRDIYAYYLEQPVSRILKPCFFASIGFSIPIRSLFNGAVAWRGLVYAVLMIVGKLMCGLVLIRPGLSFFTALDRHGERTTADIHLRHIQARIATAGPSSTAAVPPRVNAIRPAQPASRNSNEDDHSTGPNTTESTTAVADDTAPRAVEQLKTRSLYPAALLGSAMVARGEIGLLISSIAESNGSFGDADMNAGVSQLFLIVTWAILLCTISGPLVTGVLVQRVKRLQANERSRDTGRANPLGIWGFR
ncbi:hypothetical protein ANO11243_075860 [Dothideomycetidae sp. 11243]|nr:hypothetical protein ANO11243_075860 [fungal sp. No.11243]